MSEPDSQEKLRREEDLSLKRYDLLMAHLRYDQTMFWTRFGFMVVSQIGLLGIFFNLFGALRDDPLWLLFVCSPWPFIGVFMLMSFSRLTLITKTWIQRWLDLLEGLEDKAFGPGHNVFRNQPKVASARAVAQDFISTFFIIWILGIVVLIARVGILLVQSISKSS